MSDAGFDSSDEDDRFVPGGGLDSTEQRPARVVGIAEDGGGVLMAVGKDSAEVDRLLGQQDEKDEVSDLLALDDAAVRNVFPAGLPEDGECRLVALCR